MPAPNRTPGVGWRPMAGSLSPMCVDIGVDSKCPAIAQLCLKRSKHAPLDVLLRKGCHEDLFLALQPHIHHVRELGISFSSHEDSRCLLHFTGVNAPVLEMLDICINGTTNIASQIPLLLQENMPSLSRLLISGISVGGLISPVSNLTQLDLCDDPQLAPSMTGFLNVLDSSPNLHFLTIVSAGPRSEDGNPKRIVRLHSLKKLILSQCAVKTILGHLSLPLKTSIDIKNTYTPTSSTLMKETLPTSLNQLTNLHGLERIGFRKNGNTSYLFAADGPSGSLSINAEIPDNGPGPTSKCSFFLRYVPPLSVTYVRHLWLEEIKIGHSSQSEVKKTTLWAMFESMPNLESLALLRCRSDSIFQSLQPIGNRIVCAALASLIIFDNSFLHCPDLLTLAANRAAAGAAFKHVSVICAPGEVFDGVEMMQLKKHVKNVEYKIDNEGPEWPFKGLDVVL